MAERRSVFLILFLLWQKPFSVHLCAAIKSDRKKRRLAMAVKDATFNQATKVLGVLEDTPREQIQDMISSGLLADLRDGNIAQVNRDEFRKMLGLSPLNPPPEPLLGFISTVTLPARTEKFVAKDFFKVSTGRKAETKISYFGDNFKSWFLGKVEEAQGETTLSYSCLNKASVDAPIIAEQGGEAKVETTLSSVAALMERQGNGEAGVLLTNGYGNIFYIRDINGVLRAVNVRWRDVGWRVGADSVGHPIKWVGGSQVFSRNPSEI